MYVHYTAYVATKSTESKRTILTLELLRRIMINCSEKHMNNFLKDYSIQGMTKHLKHYNVHPKWRTNTPYNGQFFQTRTCPL